MTPAQLLNARLLTLPNRALRAFIRNVPNLLGPHGHADMIDAACISQVKASLATIEASIQAGEAPDEAAFAAALTRIFPGVAPSQPELDGIITEAIRVAEIQKVENAAVRHLLIEQGEWLYTTADGDPTVHQDDVEVINQFFQQHPDMAAFQADPNLWEQILPAPRPANTPDKQFIHFQTVAQTTNNFAAKMFTRAEAMQGIARLKLPLPALQSALEAIANTYPQIFNNYDEVMAVLGEFLNTASSYELSFRAFSEDLINAMAANHRDSAYLQQILAVYQPEIEAQFKQQKRVDYLLGSPDLAVVLAQVLGQDYFRLGSKTLLSIRDLLVDTFEDDPHHGEALSPDGLSDMRDDFVAKLKDILRDNPGIPRERFEHISLSTNDLAQIRKVYQDMTMPLLDLEPRWLKRFLNARSFALPPEHFEQFKTALASAADGFINQNEFQMQRALETLDQLLAPKTLGYSDRLLLILKAANVSLVERALAERHPPHRLHNQALIQILFHDVLTLLQFSVDAHGNPNYAQVSSQAMDALVALDTATQAQLTDQFVYQQLEIIVGSENLYLVNDPDIIRNIQGYRRIQDDVERAFPDTIPHADTLRAQIQAKGWRLKNYNDPNEQDAHDAYTEIANELRDGLTLYEALHGRLHRMLIDVEQTAVDEAFKATKPSVDDLRLYTGYAGPNGEPAQGIRWLRPDGGQLIVAQYDTVRDVFEQKTLEPESFFAQPQFDLNVGKWFRYVWDADTGVLGRIDSKGAKAAFKYDPATRVWKTHPIPENFIWPEAEALFPSRPPINLRETPKATEAQIAALPELAVFEEDLKPYTSPLTDITDAIEIFKRTHDRYAGAEHLTRLEKDQLTKDRDLLREAAKALKDIQAFLVDEQLKLHVLRVDLNTKLEAETDAAVITNLEEKLAKLSQVYMSYEHMIDNFSQQHAQITPLLDKLTPLLAKPVAINISVEEPGGADDVRMTFGVEDDARGKWEALERDKEYKYENPSTKTIVKQKNNTVFFPKEAKDEDLAFGASKGFENAGRKFPIYISFNEADPAQQKKASILIAIAHELCKQHGRNPDLDVVVSGTKAKATRSTTARTAKSLLAQSAKHLVGKPDTNPGQKLNSALNNLADAHGAVREKYQPKTEPPRP